MINRYNKKLSLLFGLYLSVWFTVKNILLFLGF